MNLAMKTEGMRGNVAAETAARPRVIAAAPVKEGGFTLIELMITMFIFVLTITAASQVFTGILTQFKQQSKVAETNISSLIGLELMRRDIESMGYALPWVGLGKYAEVNNSPPGSGVNAENYDDAGTPGNPPRAVLVGDDVGTNGSDYLVVKSVTVARNAASSKWTTIRGSGPGVGDAYVWPDSTEDFKPADKVMVMSSADEKLGVHDEREFIGITNGVTTDLNKAGPFCQTTDECDPPRLVYGLYDQTVIGDLRAPFNRADYYIMCVDVNGDGRCDQTPTQCAPGTGTLIKAVMRQDDGNFDTTPVFDCVYSMQVVFVSSGALANGDGLGPGTMDTAKKIRDAVDEVRVYILAHEGQMDMNFTFDNFTCGSDCITVGESATLGQNVNISGVPNYEHYRWKTYALVARPSALK